MDQNVPLARPSRIAVTMLTGERYHSSRMTKRPLGGSGGGSAFVIAIGTSASIKKVAAAENNAKLLGSNSRRACWPKAEPLKLAKL